MIGAVKQACLEVKFGFRKFGDVDRKVALQFFSVQWYFITREIFSDIGVSNIRLTMHKYVIFMTFKLSKQLLRLDHAWRGKSSDKWFWENLIEIAICWNVFFLHHVQIYSHILINRQMYVLIMQHYFLWLHVHYRDAGSGKSTHH